MASLFGLGFLKGAATTGLDRLEKREDYDRDLRKEKLLQQVRLETQKELANYEDLLSSAKASKDFSSPDYQSGKYTLRNAKGEQIGERDLTQAEKDEFSLGQEKEKLGLDKIRGEIADRGADNARQERLANAQIGSYNASAESSRASAAATRKGMAGLDTDLRNQAGSANVGAEIIRAHEKVVADAISSGIPAEEVARLAQFSAAQAGDQELGYNEATRIFLDGLRLLRQGVSTDPATGKRSYDEGSALDSINERRSTITNPRTGQKLKPFGTN